MDYNRDGIIDIVERKAWDDDGYVVYFGERDFVNDSIRFTSSSQYTPSPVIKGSELDLELDVDFTQFTEIVKVWTAPVDGTVNLYDTVQFTGATNDGVRYAIQKSRQTGDSTSTSSFLTSFQSATGTTNFVHTNVSVQKGDKVFFRINPNADGYEDEIQHNPTVTYTNKSAVDPNGVDFFNSNYAESFVLSSFGSGQGISTYDTYSFGMPNLTVNPSDSLLFGIMHIGIDSNGYKVLHSYNAVAAPNQNTTISASNFGSVSLDHDSLVVDSTQSASVSFYVSSRSNVDWNDIDWRPYIYNSVDTIYPIVDYGMYSSLVKHSDGKDIASSTYQNASTLTLTTSFNIIQGIYAPNGKEGYLVAKADDTYLGSIHLKSNGFGFVKTPTSISFPGSALSGKSKLRVEYYTSDTTLAGFFNRSAQYNLNVDGTNENNLTTISVYQRVPDELTGHNYLNWGQFAWTDTNEVAIGVHELGLFSSQGIPSAFDFNSDDNGLDSLEAFDLEEEYSIFKQKFIPLFPVRNEVIEQDSLLAPRSTGENAPLRIVPQGAIAQDRYTSVDKSLFASELRTNPGYSGSNTLDEEYNNIAYVESRYNAFGSPKKSTSLAANFSTSFGATWGLGDKTKLKPGVSYNRNIPVPSLFFGRTKVDFMDLNGDGFADQITTKKLFGKGVYARFTNPLGGAMDTIRIDSSRFSITKTIPSTNTFSVSGAIEGLKSEGKSGALIKGAGAVRKAVGAVVTPPSLTFSNHWSRMGWYDINGDGLPDFLQGYKDSSTLAINLNNGYYIDTTHRLLQGNVTKSLSQTKAFSIGVSTPSFSTDRDSWGVGAGISSGNQEGKIGLIDLNGDGLVDQLSFDGNNDPVIAINTGTKFQSLSASTLGYNPELFMFSFDVGASIRGKMTFEKHKMSKTTPYSMRKHAFSIGGSVNAGLGRVHLQFRDINGDGFVDILRTDPPVGNQDSTTLHAAAEIGIWYNRTGTTNMLKGVTNPLGGSFELTYDLVGNKYGTYPNVIEMENANDDSTYWDMPNSKWVLKTVTVDDGLDIRDGSKNDIDGTDSFTTTFNYDGGMYSRRNRAFMYFTKVESISPGGVNRSVTVHRAPTSNGTVENRQYFYYGAIPYKSIGFAKVGSSWMTVSRTTTGLKLYPVHTTGGSQGQADLSNELWTDTLAEDLVVFVAIDSTVSYQNPVLDLSTSHAFVQSQKVEYDSYMNVIKATDAGVDGAFNTGDELVSTMSYFTPTAAGGRTSQVQEHKVYDDTVSAGNLLRHTKVEQLTSDSMAVQEMRQYLTSTDFAASEMTYDSYGNVIQMKGPENDLGQRDSVRVTYDNVVHTYPIQVENVFGDYTQTTYDYSTGQVLTSEDLNGNQIKYTYDDFFRVEKILGPNEDNGNASDFTIRYQYFPEGRNPSSSNWRDKVPVAVTFHYQGQGDQSNGYYVTGISDDVVAHPSTKEFALVGSTWTPVAETSMNHLITATFSDGSGKAVQVKKDISVWNGTQQEEKRQVSGASKLNNRGLVNTQYLSTIEEMTSPLLQLSNTISSVNPTTTTYDFLSRPTSSSSPDAAGTGSYTASVGYDWETKGSDTYFVTTSTDPDGRVSKSYIDARGQQRFTISDPIGVNVETEFFYDVLGQLTSTESVDGETTTFTYDGFGRVTKEVHPDRGTTSMDYNMLGQVTSTTDANGQTVDYIYDFSRLNEIRYPTSGSLNDITYDYGSRGDGINGAGRVTQITQGSGTTPVMVEKMNYDDLGNVAVHTREIDVPNIGVQSFTSKTEYDSWGRILNMTYPDGEQLRYFHSYGGDLFRINGYDLGNTNLSAPTEVYVAQLGYDGYGNRTYMEYGNGTKTTFDYNANTLRLNQVTALTSTMNSTGVAQAMLNKTFDYSPSGNINSIDNYATHVNFPYNTLGGSYRNLYFYDGLNRLAEANGVWTGSTGPENYSVSMTYDNMGGIVQKNQTASLTYPGYPGEKYNYYYTQGNTSHPHATSKVWDRRNHKQYTYGFDNNGNPTTTHEQYAPPLQGQPNPSGPIDLIQENYWDEQNQLRGLWNLAGLHHYIYDADGQRLMKSSVPMSHGAVNAQSLQATNTIPSVEYTVYVSAGLVYESDGTSDSYTKHYYAGPLRVASQIGSGNPNYETHPTSGGNLAQGGPISVSAPTNGLAVLGDLNNMLANYGMSVSPTAPPTDTIAMQVVYHPTECDQFYAADHIERNRCLCDNFPDYALSKGIDCSPYTPIYWYHPDYIGNVEFVTDRTGQPYQHFYYAAFGDPMVSQHVGTGSFNSAFRFNAKEYDEETGNYYYGARYYEPKSSIWMGVDKLTTGRPDLTPYNFVAGNPIRLIDPDGNWHQDSAGVWIADQNDNAWTLHEDAGIGFNEAKSIMKSQGFEFSKNDSHVHVMKGDAVVIQSPLSSNHYSTSEMYDFYLNGNGSAISPGEGAALKLMQTPKFIDKHENRILNLATPADHGDFSVNMTGTIFHLGRTNVNYHIMRYPNQNIILYEFFVNDGFWDVDEISERGQNFFIGHIARKLFFPNEYIPDKMGPNFELKNGLPYPYIPLNYLIPITK